MPPDQDAGHQTDAEGDVVDLIDPLDAWDTAVDTTSDTSVPPTDTKGDVGGDGASSSCDGEECSKDQVCLNDQCVDLDEAQCRQAIDHGRLGPGERLTISGTFDGTAADGLSTGCAGAGPAPERVYRFEVTADSILQMNSTWTGGEGFDTKVEFRRGGCLNPSVDKTVCYDEDHSLWAAKGETLFAVVEHDVGPGGSFTIDLEASAAACQPDSTGCTPSGQREVCQLQGGEPTPVEYNCPTQSCADGACIGASCDQPIAVSGVGTYRFTGPTHGFDAQMSFEGNQKCLIGSETVDSKGREVIFAVELQKEQTLKVDTAADNLDNLVYLGGTCQPAAADWDCMASSDVEPEAFTFQAPTAATYYLVVDSWSAPTSGETYDYTLTIE